MGIKTKKKIILGGCGWGVSQYLAASWCVWQYLSVWVVSISGSVHVLGTSLTVVWDWQRLNHLLTVFLVSLAVSSWVSGAAPSPPSTPPSPPNCPPPTVPITAHRCPSTYFHHSPIPPTPLPPYNLFSPSHHITNILPHASFSSMQKRK